MTIKPIETIYNGYRFRSRLEARWAVFFDTLGVKYEYEKEGYDLDGVWYLPDFYLPDFDCWIEIKGQGQTKEEGIQAARKAEKLAWATGKIVFMFYDCWPGEMKDIATEPEDGPDIVIENFGYYYAPDGDSDGMMAFGFCPICNEVTIGHIGGHFICCTEMYEIYKGSCKGRFAFDRYPRLIAAYTAARQARFEHGEKGR